MLERNSSANSNNLVGTMTAPQFESWIAFIVILGSDRVWFESGRTAASKV
jgi:hypothetical protein